MSKSVNEVVEAAAEAGTEVVVTFVDAAGGGVMWFVDAAKLLTRAGEGAVNDLLRAMAKAAGAVRYTVKVKSQ